LIACAGTADHPAVTPSKGGTNIEIANFEIHADGVDRFVSCPPNGELGQDWIPTLPEWTPPPVTASDADAGAPSPPPTTLVPAGTHWGQTEKAIEDTRLQFRTCYHRGLVRDPTQDGHVAIVLRVAADGTVKKVESWGACELQREVIMCLRDIGAHLRFAPPANGADTIVMPAVFQPRTGSATNGTENDAYTAAAYVALEKLRPELHVCEETSRKGGGDVAAWGVFKMPIDKNGRVTEAAVEPWGGNQDMLECAAKVLQTLQLPPPSAGHGEVLLRLDFNPRSALH
jgi:hypothetical protein